MCRIYGGSAYPRSKVQDAHEHKAYYVVSYLGVMLTESACVSTVYTVNTIQSWIEMHGFVVSVKIDLFSCLRRTCNRLLTLFLKRVYENLPDLELSLATSLLEVMLVRERHFSFPECFSLSIAQTVNGDHLYNWYDVTYQI
jgi:hypothetical protein